MLVATEGNTLGDLLMIEIHPGWTRKKGTLTGASLPLGSVLAKVAGKYQAIDCAGAGGAEIAVAVLTEAVDASTADAPCVVIARGAAVNTKALMWPTGTTVPQMDGALAQLEALGIVPVTAL